MESLNGINLGPLEGVKGIIYLATPYTHPSLEVMEKRHTTINSFSVKMIEAGYKIYSPVSHLHHITRMSKLPPDYEHWQDMCECFIDVCEGVIVVMQAGWDHSVGIRAEIDRFRSQEKPIVFSLPMSDT